MLSNTDILRLLMNRESLNPFNTKAHPLWALDVGQTSLIQFDARQIDPQNPSAGFKLTYPKDSKAVTIGHKEASASTQEPVLVLRSGGKANGAKRMFQSVKKGTVLDTESSNANIQFNYVEQIKHSSETLHNSVVFRSFMTFLTHNQTQRIVRERMKQFQSSEKNAAILIAIPFVLGGLTALAPLFVNLSTTPTLLAGLIAHAPVVLGLMTLCGALYKLLQIKAFFDNMLDIQNIPDTEVSTYLEQYNTLIQSGLTQLITSCSSIQRSIIGFFTESDTPESNQVAPAESPLRPAAAGVAAPAIPTRAAQKSPSTDQLKRLKQTEPILRKLDEAITSGDVLDLSKKDVTRLNNAYQKESGNLLQDHQHLALNSKSIRFIYINRSDPHTLQSLQAFVTDKHQRRTATPNG